MTDRLILAILTTALASAPTAAQTPRDSLLPAIERAAVEAGELLWPSPDGLRALPVSEIDLSLEATGPLVRATLTSRFHNPTDETIEVRYVFPLPERATVRELELAIGERRIRAEVREREEARATYEAARETGRKAALLDEGRPNLFEMAAANIGPGENIEVTLVLLDEADWRDGAFEHRFPLAYTPRSSPPATGEHAAQQERAPGAGALPVAPPVTVRATIDPGFPLERVECASHAMDVSRRGARWELSLREPRVPADRELVWRWRPAGEGAARVSTFLERRDDGEWLLAMIVPPPPGADAERGLPTETLFVVDVSGSMAGPSIEQARAALLAALGRLEPGDRFDLLAFNTETHAFEGRFADAGDETLERARRWVERLAADGGTDIPKALHRAMELAGRSSWSGTQRIVFMTDGAVANETEVLAAVAAGLGETRLHVLGIGAAPNGYLLRQLARRGRGLVEFIADPREIDRRIDAFLSRLDRPVVTDLELGWDGLVASDVIPGTLPDLHAGEPLWLWARLAAEPGPGAAVVLQGWTSDGPLVVRAPIDPRRVAGDGVVASRWARARVGELMDSLHEGADPAAVRADVVELGLRFGLVTPHTSLVAVEEVPTAIGPPGRTWHLAASLPRGGTDGPLRLLAGFALVVVGLALFFLVWPWRPVSGR